MKIRAILLGTLMGATALTVSASPAGADFGASCPPVDSSGPGASDAFNHCFDSFASTCPGQVAGVAETGEVTCVTGSTTRQPVRTLTVFRR